MYPGYDQVWVALITTEGCGTSSSFGTFLQLWRIWNLASSSLLWKYMKNINCKMIRIFWHRENHRFRTKNGDCMLNFRKLHVESSSKSVIVRESLSPYVRIITWSHVRSPQGVMWKGRRRGFRLCWPHHPASRTLTSSQYKASFYRCVPTSLHIAP